MLTGKMGKWFSEAAVARGFVNTLGGSSHVMLVLERKDLVKK
jgi:hypothetical protein